MDDGDFYHMIKKVKLKDIIRLEDGTEFWVEEHKGGSYFGIHLKIPEGKKMQFIKSTRTADKNSDQ